jgi:hypothetical protein
MKYLLVIICSFYSVVVHAQSFAINTTGATADNSAMLDITSTSKGILIPRVSTAQRTAIAAPAKGLMVYDSTLKQFAYHDGTAWLLLSTGNSPWTVSGSNQYSAVSGNVGIGTTSPADKLHVVGKIRVDAGKIPFFNTGSSISIGDRANNADDFANRSNVAIGFEANATSVTASNNVAIGHQAMRLNTGSDNIGLGLRVLTSNSGSSNLALGSNALISNTVGGFNIALGTNALTSNTTGGSNVAIGVGALQSLSTAGAGSNTALGRNAGSNLVNGSGNVFLGNQAGQNETGSNKLYIDNSNTAAPLIYGNFTADSLKINGTLTVNNAYTFPATVGTANYILQTNGAGQASWVNPTSLSITEVDPQVGILTINYLPKWNGTTLGDGQVFDNGTNIGVGTATPTDKVHVVGNIKIDGGKLPFANTGQSVFIGENAGLNDDLTNNENVFVGYEAGRANTTGIINTFIGHVAGRSNTTGGFNTALGQNSLGSNTTGSYNTALGRGSMGNLTSGLYNTAIGTGSFQYAVAGSQNTIIGSTALYNSTGTSRTVAIGYGAGYNNTSGVSNVFIGTNVAENETGSNKLYIDNSSTPFPLIYGNFAADSLKVNGTLTVNNAYTFPSTAGTANYVLQTNGTGQASWVNPALLSVTEADPEVSSATTNRVPKWDGTTLTDGIIQDNGTGLGVNTAPVAGNDLTVNGKTATASIQISTGAANGYVLQSSATGNATWVNPASLAVTETDPKVGALTNNYLPKWNNTSLANGIVYDNGTNVGIGTTAPADKLHVTGNSRIENGKLSFVNNANSVLIGEGAGQNDDMTTLKGSVAIGRNALQNSVTGLANTAVGFQALRNATANSNTAIGYNAMITTTTGTWNVSAGQSSLLKNTTGGYNVSIGGQAMFENTIGVQNTAIGDNALYGNTTGVLNVGVGKNAGNNNATGSRNIFLGANAGYFETGSDKLYIDNSGTTAPLIYGDFASNILAVNGNMGIGTTAPTQAKLVINGSAANTLTYGWLNGSGNTGSATATANYSIYATDRIAGIEFNAFSDERIKNIGGKTNNAADLQTLMNIEITDYTLKDVIAKGNKQYKKVIAQQVEKVYPQAVSKMTDVVPDIYKQTEIKDGVIHLGTALKPGDKVKLIFESGEEMATVTAATATSFTVDKKQSGKVFVFGKEVNDFRTVDYEALGTLNISATQELARQLQVQKAINQKLQEQINGLRELLLQSQSGVVTTSHRP